ncbi:hypothetical protein [Georgenia yuyongxinii]|uniref:Uncharacterized protein n=1 Tax=Georgenia yuyongxinii TaxID=2589797 RepID=A0A552WPI9_9MICO|nr:hypothetical protein [Georgenia yuyongxinii]TRW44413.1 hypothetical protein FJ693_13875 [Georgenia yuyongxinii]
MTWNRTEGVLVAPTLDPEAVAAHLDAAAVVARLEWYPGTEHLLSVSVLSDGAGQVGTNRDGQVAPGPAIAELADGLGTAFDADVLMEGVHPEGRHTLEPDAEGAADPAAADGGIPGVVEDDVHDARTVVLTAMSMRQAPLQASLLRRDVTVTEQPVGEETRRLLVTTGTGHDLGVHGWDADAYPVLRLQVDDEDRTATLLPGPEASEGEPEGVAVFSWAMHSRFLYGDGGTSGGSAGGSSGGTSGGSAGSTAQSASESVRTLAHDLLGDGDDAALFAAAIPDVEPEAVAASFTRPGAEGLAAFIAALGLPAAVTEVLEGRAEPASLPGAVVHHPERLDRAAAASAKIALSSGAQAVRAAPATPWVGRASVAVAGGVAVGLVVRWLVRRAHR